MNSSYYITQIENKLNILGIDLDNKEYNDIYGETNDKAFLSKLRRYNEKLNKMLDAKNFDKAS